MCKDDKRYQDIPQWEKDTFFIFPTDRFMIRIPKPLGTGFLFGSTLERALNYEYRRDPHAFKDLSLAHSFVPAAMTGLLQAWSGVSLMTGRSIVPEREQKLMPKDQYGPYTSGTAKFIGKELNVSPRIVDTVIQSQLGGVGTGITSAIDKVVGGKGASAQPAAHWWEEPMVNRFTITPYKNSQSVNDYYDTLTQLEQKDNSAKLNGTPLRGKDAHNLDVLTAAKQGMSDLNKQIRLTQNASISPEQKQNRLDQLDKRRALLAERVMARIKQ